MEKLSGQCSSSEESKDKQIDSRNDVNLVNTQTITVSNSIPLFCLEEVEALKLISAKYDTYREAIKILIAWIETGYCNDETFTCFYSFFELLSNHIYKLRAEHDEYVNEIQNSDKNVLKKNTFQLQYDEFIDLFDALNRQYLWMCFTKNMRSKMFKMRVNLLLLKHNMLNECVCGGKVNVFSDMSLKVEYLVCDIPEMQAKLPNYTNEMKTVYRLTKEMKAKCISFWNEWPEKALENDCAGTENKWPEIRSEMKNWKNPQKTSSYLDREAIEKHPVVKFASKYESDHLDRDYISIVALLLNENTYGVDFHGIYSFMKRYIKCVCPIFIIRMLKKYPHFFEGILPTEDAHLIKKRRVI